MKKYSGKENGCKHPVTNLCRNGDGRLRFPLLPAPHPTLLFGTEKNRQRIVPLPVFLRRPAGGGEGPEKVVGISESVPCGNFSDAQPGAGQQLRRQPELPPPPRFADRFAGRKRVLR